VLLYGHSREQFLSNTILDIRPASDCDELKEIINLGGCEFEVAQTTSARLQIVYDRLRREIGKAREAAFA
jgi:hypothetical protein